MSDMLDDLPGAHLEYPLRNGIIGDWLVLGPLNSPLPHPKAIHRKESQFSILASFPANIEEIAQTPTERANCVVEVAEGVSITGMWRVVNAPEDNWVDLAQRLETLHATCGWLYAQTVLSKRVRTSLKLTIASPVQVWINGEELFQYEELPEEPTLLAFTAALHEGTNEILIRVANVGSGNVPMMVSMEIPGADGVVTLPTLLDPVARRQKLVGVMALATLAQELYSREHHVVLRWPNDVAVVDALTARLQTPAGRIYAEANVTVQRGSKVDFGEAAQFPDGQYEILLQPQFEEYYVQEMRIQRRIPLRIRNGKWSSLYYGTAEERRREALVDAASRSSQIYAEIARSALGKWDQVRHGAVEESLAQLSPSHQNFESALMALLGWVARMGDLPDFPQELTWALEESAPRLLAELDEDSTILLATCHLLAGQLYAQRSFGDLNTGEWHQGHAEGWIMRWLYATAQWGLPGGESLQRYSSALVALSHLVDLAHSDEVAGMASVVLDKVAYQIALQSFAGSWAGSQDEALAEWLPSARLGPLSGVERMWWGQGAFNAECAATVALACVENYSLPEIIAAVAVDRQQDTWLRRQDAHFRTTTGRNGVEQESWVDAVRVNRCAFRSGDTLMASAQGDWLPEDSCLLWQITMGPDTMIFGNRPGTFSTHPAWKRNYWTGNDAPVRVAQWHDFLAIAYGRSPKGTLDFTHVHFPQAHFDEVNFASGLAMARKGNGYIAITATGGVAIVSSGQGAQRELRAAAESIWLFQMGRAATDGSFDDFITKIVAQPLALETSEAHTITLRGERLQFSATRPLREALRVDGIAQPLEDFPHLESIYGGAQTLPATSLEILFHEHQLRLDLGMPEVPTAA